MQFLHEWPLPVPGLPWKDMDALFSATTPSASAVPPTTTSASAAPRTPTCSSSDARSAPKASLSTCLPVPVLWPWLRHGEPTEPPNCFDSPESKRFKAWFGQHTRAMTGHGLGCSVFQGLSALTPSGKLLKRFLPQTLSKKCSQVLLRESTFQWVWWYNNPHACQLTCCAA